MSTASPLPSRSALAGVFVVAIATHGWVLALPFQYDDYNLLRDPLALFTDTPWESVPWMPRMMLRWTLWALYALVAAAFPEPLSPVPFHGVALVLHGATAVLLARCVGRLAPPGDGARAGLLAGLVFGTASGAIQAVSWTAAWADLLLALLGLATLEAFLLARSTERASTRWRIVGTLGTWLLLVTKESGLAVVAAVVIVLACLDLPASRRTAGDRRADLRRLAGDGLAIALAVAAGLLCRRLVLGSLSLRSFDRPTPHLIELPALLPGGLQGLLQSIYPWNRSPLFAGDEPVLARLAGGRLSAAAIAAWLVASFLLVALLVLGAERRRLAATLLVLAVCLLPMGAMHDPQPLNLLARLAYVPWAPLAALWTFALLGFWRRGAWRPVAGLMLVSGAAVHLDAWVHVRFTERAQAAEQAALRDAQASALRAAPSAADLTFLVCLPHPDFAGIPSVGPLAAEAFRPPFVEPPGLDMRPFPSDAALLSALVSGALHGRDVAILGPQGAPDERAGRRPVVRVAPQRGWRGDDPLELEPTGDPGDPTSWVLAEPIPRHELLCLEARADGDVEGAFQVLSGESLVAEVPLRIDVAGRRLVVRRAGNWQALIGPPVTAIRWEGTGRPKTLTLHGRLPRLALEEPRGGELLADGEALALAGTIDDSFHPGESARLTLTLFVGPSVITLFSEAPLDHAPPGWRARFEWLHAEPTAGPGHDPWGLTWSALVEHELRPRLAAANLDRTPVQLRVTGIAPGGAPCAESDEVLVVVNVAR